MKLEKQIVEEQLNSFEAYIERGGDERAFLRLILGETRQCIDDVFGEKEVINASQIQRVCGRLDEMVDNLHENGCDKGIIVHIQTVRARIWLSVKNKGRKGVERFTGLIPEDLQRQFDQYDRFCLEVITPAWCQWILDQMGAKSFDDLQISRTKRKVFVFSRHFIAWSLLLDKYIRGAIDRMNVLPDGVNFTRSRSRDVLHLVHQGKSFQEAVAIVVTKIPRALASPDIPEDLQRQFDQHDQFCLEVITPAWCQWILDQMEAESFDNLPTNTKRELLAFPGFATSWNALLNRITWTTGRMNVLPDGIKSTPARSKDVLQLVHQGKSFQEAVATVVTKMPRALASPDIPDELQRQFDQHDQFCLEVITSTWCQWILDQMGAGSFDDLPTNTRREAFAFPGHFIYWDTLLNRIARTIDRMNVLPDGIRFTPARSKDVLQLVHQGRPFQEAVEIAAAKIPRVDIPDELQRQFDQYDQFCLEVITPAWCQWILDQMEAESFDDLQTKTEGKVFVFPGHFILWGSLLSNNIPLMIDHMNVRPDGVKLTPTRSRKLLHLVHQGRPFQDAIAIVAAKFEQACSAAQIAEAEAKERDDLEAQLKDFANEIKEGTTPQAQEIRQLISMFGGSNFIEVLFLYHPRYSSLGVRRVRKIIGEYLGNFLANAKTTFDFPDDADLPEVITPELERVLFEVLKNDILAHCNKRKREGAKLVDLDLVLEYLASKEDQLNSTPYLQRVKDKALQYYVHLFSELKKPDSMVEQITPERAFPDLNQLVNIMELSYHKQLLIADEMGLGKSNSAISAKEFLGLKRAVVVAPASVRETWASYLSDKVGENGDQIGYFKAGRTPKVLVVNSPADLEDISNYDYILISQERLTEAYTEALLHADFDYLIVDEVHKLKNLKDGKRSERIVQLAKAIHARNGYLALLSGTPIPNKVIDTAIILRLLYPQRFANLSNKELIHKVIRGDLLELKSDLHTRMQMKELASSIELPERHDRIAPIELSGMEADIYEALLEEDEFTAGEKIAILRRFCLDHQSLEIAPPMPSAKAMALGSVLHEVVESEGKAVVFVNDFITGVIRENGSDRRTLIDDLALPSGVEVCVIHGGTPPEERHEIQKRFNENDKSMILFVSGKTSDVGVSYTGATHVIHANEPWTLFEKDQQTARTYRPGLTHPIEATTLRTMGTIEAVQYEYMVRKYQAVQKIIRQIPLSEVEASMLLRDVEAGEAPEFNPELAREYLSKIQRFNQMVGALKEKGEAGLKKFLEEHAEMYAEAYRMLGTRSYQGNNARATSTLLHTMIEEQRQDKKVVRILDIASGPKTLQSRSPSEMKRNIVSLDLNPRHFDGMRGDDFIIGSYLDTPVESGSMDYCNLGFAFHYTRLVKRDSDYERVRLLAEMNRVLKVGGRAIISSINSTTMKNMELFREAIEALGFRLVREYTGEATYGDRYSANLITLEKVKNVELVDGKVNMEALIPRFSNGLFRGLKFQHCKKKKLKKQSSMIDTFSLNGTVHSITFNEEDQVVRDEEKAVRSLMRGLIDEYGSRKDIPVEILEAEGLIRWKYNSGVYRLAKKLTTASGMIIY